MPWTQQDVDTLKAAIASGRGARSITFADQSVTFHSVAEMLKLLAAMEGDVTAVELGGSASLTRYAYTRKGT